MGGGEDLCANEMLQFSVFLCWDFSDAGPAKTFLKHNHCSGLIILPCQDQIMGTYSESMEEQTGGLLNSQTEMLA